MAERRTMFQCEECTKWFFSMEVFTRHACCVNARQQVTAPADEFADAGIVMLENSTEEDIDGQIAVQQELKQSLSWSRGATLLLISDYKSKQSQIETGKMRKNKAFAEISEALKEHGYYFNNEQCASRLKTITRAYKNMKDHNSKSGNNRKSYEYEQELNDLYQKRPNINPEFVCSSRSSTSTQANEDASGNEDTEVSCSKRPASSDSESEGKASAKKCRKTQVSEVINYIQEMSKNQEERHKSEQKKKEERHKEKMSVFKDLIDVLKEKK